MELAQSLNAIIKEFWPLLIVGFIVLAAFLGLLAILWVGHTRGKFIREFEERRAKRLKDFPNISMRGGR